MSPVGENFRKRILLNPSLVNCCTVDMFTEWPTEALRSVSSSYLEEETSLEADIKQPIYDICVTIHSSVTQVSSQFIKEQKRYHYVTPSSYLEFLKLFLQLLKEKRESLNNEKESLLVGLKKLATTREAVVVLQAELSELKPYLEATAAETKKLMDEIFVDQEEVDKAKVTITMEEAEIAVTTKEIQVSICLQHISNISLENER